MTNLTFDSSDSSTDLDDVIKGLRSFIEDEVIARHQESANVLTEYSGLYGRDGRYTDEALRHVREVREASAKAGYYSMFVPESLGGAGLGSEALYRVHEDIHHQFGPHYWLNSYVIAHWTRGPSHVLTHASPTVKKHLVPDLLAGRTSMCFGLSEPDAGSDARAMRTRAVKDGDGWVITGNKIWITNGPYAEYAVIFAITTPKQENGGRAAISAFLVPTDTAGFRAEANIRMFGHPGGDEAMLYLDEVRVSDDMVLGTIGEGFSIALAGVASGRVYNSARAVGLARWALEKGTAYLQQRHTFGRPIADHQAISFPLAESSMEIHAAHLMGVNCARLIDAGRPHLKELSMAKAYSTEAATRAIDRVVQAHGAMGFTNDTGLIKAWQDVRKAMVADGTAEILRRTIVGQLLKGDVAL